MSTIAKWKKPTCMSPIEYLEKFFEQTYLVPFVGLKDDKMVSLDIMKNDSGYLVKMEVPGYNADQLDISLDNELLTVSGKMSEEKEDKNEDYYHKEIVNGSFSRSVKLPSVAADAEIKASLKDGILSIDVPTRQKEAAKKITIKSE